MARAKLTPEEIAKQSATDAGMVSLHGWWWPHGSDKYCDRYLRRVTHMEYALKYFKGRNVVVQAGGNVGVYPKWLSKRFKTVYSFEPEAVNFLSLVWNVPELNVIKINAALGNERGPVEIKVHIANMGAHNVVPGKVGTVPCLRIDDLGLPVCDFMMLDVEGLELQALRGAEQTISKLHPVLMLEDQGLPEKYGLGTEQRSGPKQPSKELKRLLNSFGYVERERVAKDAIFTWKG